MVRDGGSGSPLKSGGAMVLKDGWEGACSAVGGGEGKWGSEAGAGASQSVWRRQTVQFLAEIRRRSEGRLRG